MSKIRSAIRLVRLVLLQRAITKLEEKFLDLSAAHYNDRNGR